MRLIIDNGDATYDVPYDSSYLRLKAKNEGGALLYCDKIGQLAVFSFDNYDTGSAELECMARACNKGSSYYYLLKGAKGGVAIP